MVWEDGKREMSFIQGNYGVLVLEDKDFYIDEFFLIYVLLGYINFVDFELGGSMVC